MAVSPTSTQENRQGEAAGAAGRPASAGAWSVAESFQIAGDGRSGGALSITPSPQHQQPALVGRSEEEDEEL
jgi:hypothetical protein